FRDIRLAGLFSATNCHVFSATNVAEVGDENTFTNLTSWNENDFLKPLVSSRPVIPTTLP
ncbi:MAG: hypothetical protein OIF58_05785, partial [Cohaesibacter sp.]|nr:hypothetical protein [Cohaesibacter sp.]